MLYFFFLIFVVFVFFAIPMIIENEKITLALAIPTGLPVTVSNYAIDIPPFVADKTIKDLSKQSKEVSYLLSLLLINYLSLIPAIK